MVRMMLSVFVLLTLCSCALSANNVQVINNKLFVNGVEFIVKGLGYSPTPNGRSAMASSGYGGTGYCSSKLTPWNEWKSACYDSDYFDGSPDINNARFPKGFAPIWERDIPLIKQTGANTVRLYNTNPSTKAATQTYTNLFPSPTGKDHTQFMQMCAQNNLSVIYPLFSDNWSYANYDERTFRRYLRWQIDEVGNSPALLIWQLGNEMDWTWSWNSLWNDAAAMAKYNRYAAFIRKYTLAKWGRIVPVTNGLVNQRGCLTYQYQNFQLDIISVNVFGTDFGNLFTGDGGGWQGVTKLSCQYNKPFLMTEVGWTYQTGKTYPAGSFNQIWRSVINNIPVGLIGACYFEQNDEPALNKNFGLWAMQTTTNADGTASNQVDVWTPDTAVPKPQFYDVVNGSYNGNVLNMNSNLYTLLGRAQYKLTNVLDYCSATTFNTCPGTAGSRCSGVGLCDRVAGTCTCVDGWTGSSCQTGVCPGNPTCGGRGVCSTSVSPPECLCNDGYYGLACEFEVAKSGNGSCPSACSGNGLCNGYTSTCACWSGWIGADCSVADFGTGSLNIQQYYINCYKASSNTAGALQVTIPKLTNQKCRYYCGLRNYQYASTAAGNLCYCENVDATSQTKYTSSCTTGCVGDTTQRCGATSYVSKYRAGPAAATGYLGCYVDSGNRDLPTYIGNTNDVDACRKACNAANFAYTGLQYGGQCFCGNAYGGQGKVSDSECSMPCVDSTLTCGNGWRNSVYLSAIPSSYTYPV